MFIRQRYAVLGFALIASALALVACGGGNSATPPTQNSPSTSGTTVQVGMGDSPADWLTTFGMTVNSITLTNSNGSTVNMLSSPTQMEMMRLMGTVQPVSIMNVPQGTYTSATVSVSSIQMGYMDPTSRQYTQKTMAGPFTGTVNFNPAMTVGTTPSSLNFDMNMGSSVSIDGSGNVTITPTFTAMTNALGSGQNPWQGWMQHTGRLGGQHLRFAVHHEEPDGPAERHLQHQLEHAVREHERHGHDVQQHGGCS